MENKKRVLIIEDEPGIADSLEYVLRTEGFDTVWVQTGNEGLSIIRDKQCDFVVLDIGLPDINGFEVLKQIRSGSQLPVLCLTARAEEIDRILGLELGADDYVSKPFSPREVSARIKAILRRSNAPEKNSSCPFQIDTNKRQILYFGQKLQLSRYEFDILSLLANRPGWIFNRQKIMDLVWLEPDDSFDRTVDAHIKMLRAKLKEVRPDIDPIETHRGIGYSLKEGL
ncbi:MAG: two-component system response regulator CreB [Spirochaetes bacterium]|jgi:two-component system catabolic regulation response regulator CreB|nr:two-component system response regulator CreB [Spirochaetota bacterium]